MIQKIVWLSYLNVLLMLVVVCSNDDIAQLSVPDVGLENMTYISLESQLPATRIDDPLWIRHHDTSLKILAIGNSYTYNATAFMPYLFNALNKDSVCLAMLTRAGCTLDRHWTNHSQNLEKYTLVYSDRGEWMQSLVKTIDDAVFMLDWDIITLQQDSRNSGFYSTYQPYLNDLVNFFRSAVPNADIVWHLTWSYPPNSLYEEFWRYDYDWKKMYDAIIDAGSQASEYCDYNINSATLVKEMRETFQEVTDGFSSDGTHVTDDTAQYAISSLWYEMLVAPKVRVSCLDRLKYPRGVNADFMPKTDSIIRYVINHPIENGGSSVPMIMQ